MDATTVIGNAAVVCTVISSFAGLPICLEFFRKKSTGSVSEWPFLAGLSCSFLWFEFSLLFEDLAMQVVNVISITLQALYLVCFFLNTAQKNTTLRRCLIVIVFLLSSYLYAFHGTDEERAKSVVGYSAATASILACASPFAGVPEVIRTRSSESLPSPVIFSTFIVTSLWYVYGVLVNNNFVQVPNFIGACLSALLLAIVGFYPTSRQSIKKTE